MGQRPGHRRQQSSESHPYTGSIPCLRCDHEFQSWDRWHNRLCPRCLHELAQEPSEEPSHDLPTPLRRSRSQEDR